MSGGEADLAVSEGEREGELGGNVSDGQSSRRLSRAVGESQCLSQPSEKACISQGACFRTPATLSAGWEAWPRFKTMDLLAQQCKAPHPRPVQLLVVRDQRSASSRLPHFPNVSYLFLYHLHSLAMAAHHC